MPENNLVRTDQESLALKRINMEKAGVELVEPTIYVRDLFENKYTPSKPISQ